VRLNRRGYVEGEALPPGMRDPVMPGNLPPIFHDPDTQDPFYPETPDSGPYGPDYPSKPFTPNPGPPPTPGVNPLAPVAPYLDPFGIAPHLPNVFGPGGIGDPFDVSDDDDGDGYPNYIDPDFYKKVYRDPKDFFRRFRNRRRR